MIIGVLQDNILKKGEVEKRYTYTLLYAACGFLGA
jgi:hypothetical protein